MAVFLKVADTGSFVAAAREMRLSPTMIGKHIRFLEARLGSSLINRSTPNQHLTELGTAYLDHCRHLLEQSEEGDAIAKEVLRAPRGQLRVAAPIAFGAYDLTEAVVGFMKRFPDVSFELVLSDNIVDLVEEKIHVAICVGDLSGSTVIARALSPLKAVVCASPAYLRQTASLPIPTICTSMIVWVMLGGRMGRAGRSVVLTAKFTSRLRVACK
jgi:DNA-binding transcriptional LysR family regulator